MGAKDEPSSRQHGGAPCAENCELACVRKPTFFFLPKNYEQGDSPTGSPKCQKSMRARQLMRALGRGVRVVSRAVGRGTSRGGITTAAASRGSRSMSSSARPFRVLGLQQIAIGSLDKSDLATLWTGLLGVPKVADYKSEKENVNEDILVLGKGATAVEVDLMEPLDPSKSPKVHVPALNHVGLWVDDLKAAVTYLEGSGVRFTPGGIRKGASGHDVCFIHPKGNEAYPQGGGGVLIELVQAPQDVIDGSA